MTKFDKSTEKNRQSPQIERNKKAQTLLLGLFYNG